jgi:hypothetical protein
MTRPSRSSRRTVSVSIREMPSIARCSSRKRRAPLASSTVEALEQGPDWFDTVDLAS